MVSPVAPSSASGSAGTAGAGGGCSAAIGARVNRTGWFAAGTGCDDAPACGSFGPACLGSAPDTYAPLNRMRLLVSTFR